MRNRLHVGLFLAAAGAMTFAQTNAELLKNSDVVWESPSSNAAGSMPIGNGEVVLNTWVNSADGDLCILIARTDSLSEISRILKLGLVRVRLSPTPFLGAGFEQRLSLSKGLITFSGDKESMGLFVDSGANVIHLTGKFKKPRKVQVILDHWRSDARELPKADIRSAWSVHDAPFSLIESADVATTVSNGIQWRHVNKTSIVPKLWENQSLVGLDGLYDPLIGRTFGGLIVGSGLYPSSSSNTSIGSRGPQKSIQVRIASHTNQNESSWSSEIQKVLSNSPTVASAERTSKWWHAFWNRSWVFVNETHPTQPLPANEFPLRKGVDSGGQNRFPGQIESWRYLNAVTEPQGLDENKSGTPSMPDGVAFRPANGLTLQAKIRPEKLVPRRIFDQLTAGSTDGFLFDTHPGNALRLIVGDVELSAPNCLTAGEWHQVAATYDPIKGQAAIYLNGKRVAFRESETGSMITKGYTLQRYAQACQGRGEYPIKFNGGYFTVEPSQMGISSNHDFRNWGDAFWFQNVRHIYHPMLASGDFEMMEPFWKLYERARPLAESRTAKYHGAKGLYFPETMTPFGTYSGGDYGWDRAGLQPKDVQCPWWDDAWNQGPELVDLMLDRWDYLRDDHFLTQRVIPMAVSILHYFDTRFAKDKNGKIILDPTQVVETYWEGVVNDTPTVAGLIAITERLSQLPSRLISPSNAAFFARMRGACPPLPVEEGRIAPAETYGKKISNVENGELYAVWPFRVATMGSKKYFAEAKAAYSAKKNDLSKGWGYDGNVAALLGMTDEAAKILNVKVRNSHPSYRWPATWGPNFDWLPDQNHGGNLLNTTHLMLLQAEPLSNGGAIRLLPAWPQNWDVRFKLHARGKTTVECEFSRGTVVKLVVQPSSRRKDIVLPNFSNLAE